MRYNLFFENCEFNIDLRDDFINWLYRSRKYLSNIANKILRFENCNFNKNICLKVINFHSLEIKDCIFKDDIKLKNIKIDSLDIKNLSAKNSQEKINFEKNIELLQVSINELYIENILFNGSVDFDSSRINKIYSCKSIFNDTFSLKNNTFEEKVSFINTIFQKKVDFSHCIFEKEAKFKKCKFLYDGKSKNKVGSADTDFSSIDFNDEVYFDQSEFEGFVAFHMTKFTKQTSFYETKFEKMPNFSPGNFGDVVYFNTAKWEHGFKFEDVEKNIHGAYNVQGIERDKKKKDQLIENIINFRDSCRAIKNALIKENNLLDAQKFHKAELYCKEIELKENKKLSFDERVEWVLLLLYRLTSDHHTNLSKILHILLIVIASYGMTLFVLNCVTNCITSLLGNFAISISCFFVFIYLLYKFYNFYSIGCRFLLIVICGAILINEPRLLNPVFKENTKVKSIKNNPIFLGIIQQKFRIRNSEPTKAYENWISDIRNCVNEKLVPALERIGCMIDQNIFKKHQGDFDPYDLAQIPDFNTLIAISQRRNKPVFLLDDDDLKEARQFGAAKNTSIEKINDLKDLFSKLGELVINLTGQPS